MKEKLKGAATRKAIFKEWSGTALEILKWLFVLWLILPMRSPKGTLLEFARIMLGYLLFIIFGGKVFYDTIIMGMIRQRHVSAKKDTLMFFGMVLIIAVIVGFVIVLMGILFIGYINNSQGGSQSF